MASDKSSFILATMTLWYLLLKRLSKINLVEQKYETFPGKQSFKNKSINFVLNNSDFRSKNVKKKQIFLF